MLAAVAVCSSTVAVSPRPAGASKLASERARAVALYNQIQRINGHVEFLGQRYDQAQIKLNQINNEITNTRSAVANIERRVHQGNSRLRSDAIFAYVTNGSAQNNNPLFCSDATKIGATNVYNRLAEGNIGTTLANLKNNRIELTQQRSKLAAEDRQAAAAAATAKKAFREAQGLQASLQRALAQVKGQIAYYVRQAAAAAAAKAASAFGHSKRIKGFPAPPPNSKANIAIRAAESFIGVPYVWGGASHSGVDCSGLIMLAYAAAGIFFPHYSGAQYADTVRVPLWAIRPGDLLFYGWHGNQHVAMYVGHGAMIEAEMTGTRVHITPVRLGYGFAGLGRPRT